MDETEIKGTYRFSGQDWFGDLYRIILQYDKTMYIEIYDSLSKTTNIISLSEEQCRELADAMYKTWGI